TNSTSSVSSASSVVSSTTSLPALPANCPVSYAVSGTELAPFAQKLSMCRDGRHRCSLNARPSLLGSHNLSCKENSSPIRKICIVEYDAYDSLVWSKCADN